MDGCAHGKRSLDALYQRTLHELLFGEHPSCLFRYVFISVARYGTQNQRRRTRRKRSRSIRPALSARWRWYTVSSIALSSATRSTSLGDITSLRIVGELVGQRTDCARSTSSTRVRQRGGHLCVSVRRPHAQPFRRPPAAASPHRGIRPSRPRAGPSRPGLPALP
jgi:hypothetical protein